MTPFLKLLDRFPIPFHKANRAEDILDKQWLPTTSSQASQKPADCPGNSSYNRLDPSNPGVDIKFYPLTDTTKTEVHAGLEQVSYHDVIISEARELTRTILVNGNKHLRCYLFWLPIEVRFNIYEELFTHDGSPLEIGRLVETPMASLAILRTCHVIYHEASIALYHSLRYRHLFLRAYGSFSAYFLRRKPNQLPCCRTKIHDYLLLQHPCQLGGFDCHRPYGSVTFLIGADDPRVALRRCWDFAEFITTMEISLVGAVEIYSVTVVATNNWKLGGFDERTLVRALFGGAFKILRELRLRGFTPDERGRLCQIIDSMRVPHLRIDRKKRKIQGQGFSIWICKSPNPSLHRLSPSKTLKYKIYYGEENIPISFCGFKAESHHKQSLFTG